MSLNADSLQRSSFLMSKFKEYYQSDVDSIKPPLRMAEREYGFMLFREKAMIRHRAFNDFGDFYRSLLSLIPSDVYYSTAYYEKPNLGMDQKGWLGSDLVFDVDADHIDTPCKEAHDTWTCLDCKETKRGKKPSLCPKCGHEKIEEKSWLCERCLFAAKEEMAKLREFLQLDFGVKSHEIHLIFSGHRGYHLHVISEKLKSLDDIQRKEIVDYVMALGLDLSQQGLYQGPQDIYESRSSLITGPQLTDPGWRGRLAKGVYRVIIGLDEKELNRLGFSKGAASQILKEREIIEKEWSQKILWSYFQDRWGVTDQVWKNIIEKALTLMALPANVDTVVTTDIHRLIRMPETLNGKTGLKATNVNLEQLEDFDPFCEPVVFEGTQKVYVRQAPELRICDNRYGPFSNEKVEVPLAVAVLLVAKSVALPVQ